MQFSVNHKKQSVRFLFWPLLIEIGGEKKMVTKADMDLSDGEEIGGGSARW